MWTVSLSLKLALFLLVVSKICFWISARRLSSSADKLRCEEKKEKKPGLCKSRLFYATEPASVNCDGTLELHWNQSGKCTCNLGLVMVS